MRREAPPSACRELSVAGAMSNEVGKRLKSASARVADALPYASRYGAQGCLRRNPDTGDTCAPEAIGVRADFKRGVLVLGVRCLEPQ
jgi:hypothetical protein